MEKRTKAELTADKRYKAMGVGERTSKKVATIKKSDGTSFKRRNANQFGNAEGDNDYTETRVNRTDRFKDGGTMDSSDDLTAPTLGGTMSSSLLKEGGTLGFTYEIGGL